MIMNISVLSKKIWSTRKEFTKYFLIGSSGVVLDIVSLFIFKEYLHLRPVLAVIVNQFFLIIYVFYLNKHWAFRNSELARPQAAKFISLAGTNYVFSILWMLAWNEHLGFNYLLVRLINIAMAVSWNFLLYKFWVFKKIAIYPG